MYKSWLAIIVDDCFEHYFEQEGSELHTDIIAPVAILKSLPRSLVYFAGGQLAVAVESVDDAPPVFILEAGQVDLRKGGRGMSAGASARAGRSTSPRLGHLQRSNCTKG